MLLSWLPWRRPVPPALVGTLALLRLLPRVHLARTVSLAFVVLLDMLLPIALTVVTGLLIGSIPAAMEGGLDSPAARLTLTWLVVAGALFIALEVLGPAQEVLGMALGRYLDLHLQERVILAVGRPHGIAHLEDPVNLDQIQAAQGVGMSYYRPKQAVRALATLVPVWFVAAGSALILVTFHWALALVMLLLSVAITYFSQKEIVRVANVGLGQSGAVRRADYFRDLALTPEPAKEVRIWGLGKWLVGHFDREFRRAMVPLWHENRLGRPIIWLMTLTYAAANLGALVLLAWAATQGNIGLAALAVYARAVLDSIAFNFSDQNTRLAYAVVSLLPVLELERRFTDRSQRGSGYRPAPGSPHEGIECRGLSFRYPGQTDDVLDRLDLSIPAGQSLAIVGANGAGKTTLIKLLCRLYDPGAGSIAVDGHDLQAMDADAWQAQVAAIFQDFVQYPLSARENIRLGAPNAAPDAAALTAAARKAGALELIEALPRGWDTILSRRYTDGTDLSGGQWQRVALARALFAVESGARLLILDEPTANLDVRAEAALYDRFLEITAGLTTVIISHRFSTVRRADRICVLADGQITEQGTHDELMALAGQYAQMYTLQASRFRDDPSAPPDAGENGRRDADGTALQLSEGAGA